MKLLCVISSLLFFSGMAVANEKMFFERQLIVPVIEFKTVEIIAGAGTLKVIGGSGEEIIVDATVQSADYSKMAEFVDEFETKVLFFIKQEQGIVQIMAKPRKSMYNTPNIQTNLVVRLPSHVNLNVDDGSGSLQIENISGRLNIDNEAGLLKISQVRNDLFIKDGDGSMTITDVNGQVNIDDKAGSIDAKNINGNLTLDDGSGDVKIEGLNGQFILKDAGSGKIEVNGKIWPKK